MLIIRDSDTERIDASVLTIGAFDGVHIGHQKVIGEVIARAAKRGVRSAVVTFDQHPALVVRPESAPKLLTTIDRKLELLAALGIDVVFIIEFDTDRASTTAQDFVHDVFVDRLNVVEIVVGADFHFGKGREGTVSLLTEQGKFHGFHVSGLDLLSLPEDDRPGGSSGENPHVSSTSIREALAAGRLDRVSFMLGRQYEISGPVSEGDKRGRTIGFPTANVILPDDMARPALGVYAAWYETPDGAWVKAAVNVGVRPTFYENADAVTLEAHLLDFSGDLYNSTARVRFVKRLRGEQRFDGIEALKMQLQIDVAQVRHGLGAGPLIEGSR